MRDTDFLSKANYIKLPSSNNPKVYLAVNSKEQAKLSFRLYNPFSKKAKVFKNVILFCFVYFNSITKYFLSKNRKKQSHFILFLNTKLNTNVTSSLYKATAKDKLVLQLKDNQNILGYLKYPVNSLGEQRLENEAKAISILSKKGIVDNVILKEKYFSKKFIILKNIEGTINTVSKTEYQKVLKLLKKENKCQLKNHPRVVSILEKLKKAKLVDVENTLIKLVNTSSKEYLEVYEHGDFAPWNLIKTNKGIVPFDFEYFEEVGLEHLDEIKYNFQIEKLIKKLNGFVLINILDKKLNLTEFKILFAIFLAKEILIKYYDLESYDFELNLLELLENEKI